MISSTASIQQQQQQQQQQQKSIDNDQDSQVEELDPKRFEKISNIIKTYKQSITKLRTNFKNLIIRGSNGTNFYIDIITDNMFIMIVLKDKKDTQNMIQQHEELLILDNIKAARKWFEKIENNE